MPQLRTGVEARLKTEARGHPSRRLEEVRRQFLLQRFLARVFADPETGWILKGGTGLLVRVPNARHSNDIDLLYIQPEALLDDAVSDLRRRVDVPPGGDLLRFELADPRRGGGQGVDHVVAQIKVIAYLGVIEYGRFPIDLSLNQRVAEPVERRRPRPVVELPGSDPLPEFVLYPLADQIADKVCAMYGLYGPNRDQPSTRYRDLVDLAIIVTHEEIDAARATEVLRDEAKLRELELPQKLVTPSDQWQAGYSRTAAETILPVELRTIEGALETVGRCLDPLLAGTAEGIWNPTSMQWAVSTQG
jgi:predicted nucleotidyltransferase component of viral defense system